MSAIKAKFTLNPVYKNLSLDDIPSESEGLAVLRHIISLIWQAKSTLLLVALLMGPAFAIFYNDAQINQFIAEAKTVSGQVTSCQERGVGGKSDPEQTLITYSYVVQGETYGGVFQFGGHDCDTYPPGKQTSVSYHPAKPAKSYFEEAFPRSYAACGGVFVVLGALVLLGMADSIRTAHTAYIQKQRLERDRWRRAVLLEGEIIGVHGARNGSDFMVTIQYEFLTPQHKMLTGSSSAYRRDLDSTKLPLVGWPIVVFYIDDQQHIAL